MDSNFKRIQDTTGYDKMGMKIAYWGCKRKAALESNLSTLKQTDKEINQSKKNRRPNYHFFFL